KPSNVLVAADEIPRLTDFHPTCGVSFGTRPADASAGMCYLAPELLREPPVEPRQCTDVYGLGVVLYELLTGKPPFAGAGAHKIVEQVRTQDPVPPTKLNAQVPPSVEAFCLRCLKKNPWRRYTRLYDVLRRLRSLQENLE